jgi:peptidoglycan/xylan/chitin deacetylase (PgdA/CDA1 family)
VRQVLKGVVEAAFCGSGMPRVARWRRRGSTLILAYHNIVPDGAPVAGDGSLHLAGQRFADQLDTLSRTHEIVSLREALELSRTEAPARAGARPRAVITFDDATQGALTAGVAELSRRRLPATVFVAPGFVGGHSFWWDAVTELSEELRALCLTALQGRDGAVRRWAAEHDIALRDVPAHQTCATEDQLHAAVTQGIELGAHSWSHPNLTMLSGADLESELVRPLEWLRARFTSVLPVVAYPYGFSSPGVGAATRSAGYEAALRVDGGWLDGAGRSTDRYSLPRQNVAAGLSARGFRLLASGVRLHR